MHPCLSVRTILSGFIKQDMLKSVIVNKWKRRYECRLWSLKQDSHFGRNHDIKLQIKLNTTRAYKLVMLFRDVKVGKKRGTKSFKLYYIFKVLEFTNSVIEFWIIKKVVEKIERKITFQKFSGRLKAFSKIFTRCEVVCWLVWLQNHWKFSLKFLFILLPGPSLPRSRCCLARIWTIFLSRFEPITAMVLFSGTISRQIILSHAVQS